jgi:glycosyltransferase involved in cell wall biosynthesis
MHENYNVKNQTFIKQELDGQQPRGIHLSMIVPCYNEAPHLYNNLLLLKKVLAAAKYPYEIIIIDDCSSDETLAIARSFADACNDACGRISIVAHEKNQGRGKTVADGIYAAAGDIVGFIDIDFSTSPWNIFPLVAAIEDGADVALGLRIYKVKLKNIHRWIVSKGYRVIARLLLRMNLGDTESGCKFFNRRRILPVLPDIQDTRWFWDTEVMVRAHLADLQIIEVPALFIRTSLYSRVKIIRDSWRHFHNLLRLVGDIHREQRKKDNVV